MANVVSTGVVQVPVGYSEFIINALRTDTDGISLTLDRLAWPDGDLGTLKIEVRNTDLDVWEAIYETTLQGGVMLDKFGQPRTQMQLFVAWSTVPNGERMSKSRVRFSMTVAQAFSTKVALQVL